MGSSASSNRNSRPRQQPQQQVQQPVNQQPVHQQPPPQQQQRPAPQFPNGAPPPHPPPNIAPHQGPNSTPPPQQGVAEAQTIKNLCVVTPESVKFDQPNCLLRFETNCIVPATLEVHVAVRCDVMHGNCMITPNKPKPPPPKVPVPAGTKAHEIPIDLTGVSSQEQNYVAQYPKQIPVVLELSYDAPADDKHSESFRMAEFTMVQLLPTGKVAKTLLRARDGVYKVEHLFGGEHADVGTVVTEGGASPASANSDVPTATVDDDEEEGLCVICLTNDKTTVVMPCRHLCLCKECAEELRQRGPKCPVCRGPISQMIAVK